MCLLCVKKKKNKPTRLTLFPDPNSISRVVVSKGALKGELQSTIKGWEMTN